MSVYEYYRKKERNSRIITGTIVALTIIAMLVSLVCALLGVWIGDIRWGSTSFIVFCFALILGIIAGLRGSMS